MKVTFLSAGCMQTGNTSGIVVHSHAAGATVDLPDDVATLFVAQGVAEPVVEEPPAEPPVAELAVNTAGETATKAQPKPRSKRPRKSRK